MGCALLFVALVLARQLSGMIRANNVPVDDFTAYWAAGRLIAMGEDPYDAVRFLSARQQVGWQDPKPVNLQTPPWALAPLLPLAILSYPLARLIWLALNLILLVLCTDWLWRSGLDQRRLWWLAMLLGATFAPVVFDLAIGQISMLVLTGVVGFLYFQRRKLWFLAGAVAALTLIKPQLVLLFWIAILLWSVRQRRWSVLLGAGAAWCACTAVVSILNPAALGTYFHNLLAAPPVEQYTPTTIGALLSLILGSNAVWLHVAPPVLGLLWFAWYWRRMGQRWEWNRQTPVLLLVSLWAAPYAWMYDQVLLLPALLIFLGLCVHHRRAGWVVLASLCYVAVNSVLLAPPLLNRIPGKWWYVLWMLVPSLFVIAYMALRKPINEARIEPLTATMRTREANSNAPH